LLIDVEIFRMMASMLEGFGTGEEDIAMELIKKVGHESDFMGNKATVDTMKKMWHPRLTDVTPYANWVSNGSKDIVQRAHEEAERIRASHKPEQLHESVKKEIGVLLKKAVGSPK